MKKPEKSNTNMGFIHNYLVNCIVDALEQDRKKRSEDLEFGFRATDSKSRKPPKGGSGEKRAKDWFPPPPPAPEPGQGAR